MNIYSWKNICIFFLSALGLIFLIRNIEARDWDFTIVDSDGDVGQYSSIAVDSNQNIHISYYNSTCRNLKYAYYDGAWNIQTVDPTYNRGDFSSMALDSNNNPHISYHYYDAPSDSGLKYAFYDSNWNMETTGWRMMWCSDIAVDSHNNPHISYHSMFSPAPYKYAHLDGTWYTSTFENDTEMPQRRSTSIVIDSSDNAHVLYYLKDLNTLKYVYDDGGWNYQTVDQLGGSYNSIVLDSADNLHVSYIGNGYLKYAYYDGTWSIETIDSAESYTSIAIDNIDNPHISYISGADLKYAYFYGGWHIETVDSTGEYNTLALDNFNGVHIAYYDGGNLKYAYSEGWGIADPSHPDQSKWYYDDTGLFNWSQPSLDIVGYLYVFDQSPSSWVAFTNASYTESTSHAEYNIQSGVNYFHIATVNDLSVVGDYRYTYRVKYSTSPPEVSSPTHPDEGNIYPNPDPMLLWDPPYDDEDSFPGYYYLLNQQSDYSPTTGDTYTTLKFKAYSSLSDGTHYFHIRSTDCHRSVKTSQ